MNLFLAWLVHLYSAIGAVLAFISILFIFDAQFKEALSVMAVAVLIDATDGTLARRFRVKEVLPWFDGGRLDDIADYLNYVLVPCVFMFWAQLLPQRVALGLVALPLVASAYGFCHKEAKTADHYFLGFPSYWNIVAFYLYVLASPLWFNGTLIVAFSVLVFVPIRYVYPSRNAYLRPLTLGLGGLWGISIFMILLGLPKRSQWLNLVSLLFPVYYLLLSFWLEARRRLLPL